MGSGGRDFNPDLLSLVERYGMKPRTIGIDCPDQNGDVESLNGHLKRRLEQHLLLRGYRDFESVVRPNRPNGRWRVCGATWV